VFLLDLFSRYAKALADARWLAAIAVAAAVLLSTLAAVRVLRRITGVKRALALAVLAAGALWWAWQLRWLCDDAYISFRYADNWARGLGLVFNPGERVEGYTNFLWTVLMGLFIKLGADPGQAAVVVGLGCFVALLVILDRLGSRLGANRGQAGLGIAPFIAAASYTVASFATSGLETMFAATLMLLAVERAESGRPLTAGLAGVLAAMAHPDHGIFYAALGAALLLSREHRRDLVLFAAPFFVLFVPYFFWRWRYYGDLFPNTYYAKSAGETYFRQGGIYLFVTFVVAGLWAAAPLAAIGAYRFRKTVAGRAFLIGLPLFCLYVAKVGGDFMLGRLLVPVIALVVLFADLGWRELQAKRRPVLAGGLAALAALAAVPARAIQPGEKVWNLADERTFYPLTTFSPPTVGVVYTEQARTLNAALQPRQLRPKLAVGCVGIVGYHTRLPIFDLFGLTSRSVAHMPIPFRGRPGHEKLGTVGHVLAAGVDLSEFPLYPFPYGHLTTVQIGGFTYHLARYDAPLVRSLAGAARVADFPAYLAGLAQETQPVAPDVLACDLWFLESYYFSRNPDPGMRQTLIDRALRSDSTLRGLEPLLLSDQPLEASGYQPVRRFSFERREPFVITGDAFADWPSDATTPGQTAAWGNHGRFLNTFRPGTLDAARGLMKLPSFPIQGDVISLLVAGGKELTKLRVSLIVDGQPVRQATGCVSENLGRRLWNVRDYAGRTAHLEVLDDSASGWGHLLVDEITEWRAPPAKSAR
jgi:arabinofuranosyltransferase